MLALAEQEALCCDGCGGWLPDTTLKSNTDGYEIPKPIRCHSCDAASIGRKLRGDKERPEAQRWPVPKLRSRG